MEMHTPGPWKSSDDLHGSFIIGSDRNWIARTFCDKSEMAGITSRGPLHTAAEANARLIAAAPDLLVALVDLMRETDDGTQLCARDFAEAALAAIAKAVQS